MARDVIDILAGADYDSYINAMTERVIGALAAKRESAAAENSSCQSDENHSRAGYEISIPVNLR